MDDWPAGVIHALQLDGTGGAREARWDEALGWRPGVGCLWVHLHLDEPSTRAYLEAHSGLNDIAIDGLLMEETRPRVLTRANNLLLTVRGINLNPGEDPEDMVSLRQALASLRKRTIAIRRYLAPQREALARLATEPVPWVGELDRLRLREIADRQVRLVEAIDEVRERAAVAHDELAARLSEQLNARMYLLSLVAALFLPLGFFTGLMGINVGGMPGVESESAFWVVAGGCAVAAVLVLGAFRLRRWL